MPTKKTPRQCQPKNIIGQCQPNNPSQHKPYQIASKRNVQALEEWFLHFDNRHVIQCYISREEEHYYMRQIYSSRQLVQKDLPKENQHL